MALKVKIISLGGAISMGSSGFGLSPALGAGALAEGLRAHAPEVELVLEDLSRTASANRDVPMAATLATAIADFANLGGSGVIVTQGAYTLEETAFLTELLAPPALPVTFTGAMRGASADSADGPANLANDPRFVASPSAAGELVVVMSGEVHAARHFRKTHTTSLATFSSGDHALRRLLHEGRFLTLRPPYRPLRVVDIGPPQASPRVWIATLGLDIDETLFEAGERAGVDGWLIAALGPGQTPERLKPRLSRPAQRALVVPCRRTGGGIVCERIYNYPGSETDPLARGLITCGLLSRPKARGAQGLVGKGPGYGPFPFRRAGATAARRGVVPRLIPLRWRPNRRDATARS